MPRSEPANRLRGLVKQWQQKGYPDCTRITVDLLRYWNYPERERKLFFCQREATETIIFLAEARADYRQGIEVPLDEPGPDGRAAGYRAFRRYACKMATGTGKTTVMAMLIARSVLNKVADRTDKRFSDTVLVVCPNVTIREQLARALDPNLGEESLYRIRDLVPADRVGQDSARVVKRGLESDAALVRRVLGEAAAHRRNILVINDEAHHAYRRGTAGEPASGKPGANNGGEECLTPGERGGRRGQIKPEAILWYAQPPLVQLAGLWRETFAQWQRDGRAVPPVFIVVCRDTALAQVVFEWLSKGGAIPEFANPPGREYTVRIDSKVVESIETGIGRNDEELRLRYVLATVGKTEWPAGAPSAEWVNLCALECPRPRAGHLPAGPGCTAWPRRALHRQCRHADGRLGCGQRYAHSRPAAFRIPTSLRTGGRPRASAQTVP